MPLVDDGFEALLEPFYNGKKLTDPISTKEDKFQLLPAFLKVKGMAHSSPSSPVSRSVLANNPSFYRPSKTVSSLCIPTAMIHTTTDSFHRHIDSYNFFVEQEIKEIVATNQTIRSDVDSNFWLKYVLRPPSHCDRLGGARSNTHGIDSPIFGSKNPRDWTMRTLGAAARSLRWNADSAT
jgi:DNA-directed RNA polymerase III subunit RPC2